MFHATMKITLALIPVALAAIEEHRVDSLPGFDGPLPSAHYSGYLPVGNTTGVPGFIHCASLPPTPVAPLTRLSAGRADWLIMSENDPANDPLVYWTNGGPGGSGINVGLLTEMGQIHANENSFANASAGLRVFYNPYSWSRVANTLYVSQPKGVGYSYCADASAPCENDDATSAQDAYDFFLAFFDAYPELRANDFYLTAESYGGIYIPTFMREIDQRGGVPNFVGAAIGDGCWGTDVGLCAFGSGKSNEIQANFFLGHSMIDQPLFRGLERACANATTGEWADEADAPAECVDLLAQMDAQAGDFNVYNVYDTCADDAARGGARGGARGAAKWRELLFARRSVSLERMEDASAHPQLPRDDGAAPRRALGALGDYPCGNDRAAAAWLAQPEVAAALHVDPGAAARGMNYTWGPSAFSGDLRPLYAELARKYRMLIYSGDTDACVPTWGTDEWVRELGFAQKDGGGWRAWTSPLEYGAAEQRAGYVVDYDVNDFKFVTVQGAGHMIPLYKPYFALTMISKFLKNEDF